jgi:L-serine dehydratase
VNTSLFDLYKIGVGPSSSHTMGPMRAAARFVRGLAASGSMDKVARLRVELYGSLALTGLGHATDRAVLLGLAGFEPASIDPARIEAAIAKIRREESIALAGTRVIAFHEAADLLFRREERTPPGARRDHPNGLRLTAFDDAGRIIDQRTYFSIGGGFIVEDGEADAPSFARTVPFPFQSAAELLSLAREHELTVSRLMLENECALAAQQGHADAPLAHVRAGIAQLWSTMQACIERGMNTEGVLPGGLQVPRRARRMAERLRRSEADAQSADALVPLDWLTVFAMAVNEENAAGGRVVTAPTNGAAGVVPAVAQYYARFVPDADDEGIQRFFLASAAIGKLYKENASISGAEVGCQGEVGVACSMAAAGLIAALNGTNGQLEHAAEMAMEHNLGMTCDPIAGLVQIPCIERNAMGAAKAVLAARIALHETEAHKVSLDQVIRTMYLTGLDMQSRYKETSLAGLALNVIAC